MEGQDSLDAHAADEPLATHDWPAPVSEWPASKPCDWCRSWPASHEAMVGAGDDRKQVHLCEDCAKRHRYAGFTSSETATLKPGVERDLLKRWKARHSSELTLPDKFPDLALLGKENDNTHLATVYADGNAVGKLNKELRDLRRNGIGANFDLPQAISNATWSALLAAIEEMSAGTDEMMPVIAHLVGGDDVLVSIPAHEAWWFTRTLQITFQDALAAELADAGLADLPVPTVSAAIVFHHKFSPLPAAVDLAGDCSPTPRNSIAVNGRRWRGRTSPTTGHTHSITSTRPTPSARPGRAHRRLGGSRFPGRARRLSAGQPRRAGPSHRPRAGEGPRGAPGVVGFGAAVPRRAHPSRGRPRHGAVVED